MKLDYLNADGTGCGEQGGWRTGFRMWNLAFGSGTATLTGRFSGRWKSALPSQIWSEDSSCLLFARE